MTILAVAVVAVMAAQPFAPVQPTIANLEWLIGTWHYEDVATPAAGFSYRETGPRTCEWALRKQYIRCESQGGSAARPRSYVVYLNYSAQAGRFEMLSMWSNVPGKELRAGQLSADGRELRLRSVTPEKNDAGALIENWSIIRYDGRSTYTWESGRTPVGAQQEGPVRFRDFATRVSTD